MDKKILRDLQIPQNIVYEISEESKFKGHFIMKPLEKGYAITLGNSLRRVLYSSLHGYAITFIKIDYEDKNKNRNFIKSEFDNIPFVMEDTLDIITNIKALRLKLVTGVEKKTFTVEIKGAKKVTGKDFAKSGDLEIINPDHHILTITEEGTLTVEFVVEWGKGFVAAEKRIESIPIIGYIPVDSIFSPIVKVNFIIESARVENITDYEALIIDIETDGSVMPKDALEQASYLLIKYFSKFLTTMVEEEELFENEIIENKAIDENDMKMLTILDQSLDTLEFTERIKNCFNSANIKTFRDLLSLTENQLGNLKNFGQKSLEIVKEKIRDMGINLGVKEEIDRIEKLYKKNN